MIKYKNLLLIAFSALTILILGLSCEKDPVNPEDQAIYGIPVQLNDGWEISTPTIQNMDINKIQTLSSKFQNGDYGQVDGFLIARNNKLIWEEYFNNYQVDKLHLCYSVSKSVNSALLGIAMSNGYLDSVNQKIKSFFPEYAQVFNQSSRKNDLSLFHLLTMSSGLQWNELQVPYSDPANNWNQMTSEYDLIKYVLERPARKDPGTVFEYNSGLSVILGETLSRATGTSVVNFATENLFNPLGITDFYWEMCDTDTNDLTDTGGGLRLRPRDMAKIGQLYLDNGNYKGNQIISEQWVENSLEPRLEAWNPMYYGYQWWAIKYTRVPQPGVYETCYIHTAIGYSGQYIFLVPVNNLVVVMTGTNGQDGTNYYDIMFNHVLEAVLE